MTSALSTENQEEAERLTPLQRIEDINNVELAGAFAMSFVAPHTC